MQKLRAAIDWIRLDAVPWFVGKLGLPVCCMCQDWRCSETGALASGWRWVTQYDSWPRWLCHWCLRAQQEPREW